VANTAAHYYLSGHNAVRRLLVELSQSVAPDEPPEPALADCNTA
jgi:hypothetical protein